MLFITPLPDWVINLSVLSGFRFFNGFNDFILNYGAYVAAAIFIAASVTDAFDGYLARKNNQITSYGAFLDPIADKLLITASLVALCDRGLISAWTVVIIIGREFIVTGLRLVAANEGVVISAGKSGKIKMIIQIIVVFVVLIVSDPSNLWVSLIVFVMVIATIYSGVDYFVKNKEALKNLKMK